VELCVQEYDEEYVLCSEEYNGVCCAVCCAVCWGVKRMRECVEECDMK
jgi:hypothetical protein